MPLVSNYNRENLLQIFPITCQKFNSLIITPHENL